MCFSINIRYAALIAPTATRCMDEHLEISRVEFDAVTLQVLSTGRRRTDEAELRMPWIMDGAYGQVQRNSYVNGDIFNVLDS